MFDRSNFQLWETVIGARLSSNFLKKTFDIASAVIFLNVSRFFLSWFQMSLRIFDLNLQARVSCDVLFRLCVQYGRKIITSPLVFFVKWPIARFWQNSMLMSLQLFNRKIIASILRNADIAIILENTSALKHRIFGRTERFSIGKVLQVCCRMITKWYLLL